MNNRQLTHTLTVNKSLLTGSDIRLPSSLDSFLRDELIRGKMIFDEEEFDITITSMKKLLFTGNSQYLLRMNADFRRKAKRIFAYTFTLYPFHKKLEFNETITFNLERTDDVVYFREVSRKTYQGEALPFMQMMAEKSIVEDINEDEYDEDESEEKDRTISAKKPLNLRLKRLDMFLPQTSNLFPIEDLDKHHLVSNCIYIWYAEKTREVYIGSAITLQKRMTQHKKVREKKMCHITHFAYLEFNKAIPMPLVRMVERILIKASSLLLPNLSDESSKTHARNPVNKDMNIKLMNKAYH